MPTRLWMVLARTRAKLRLLRAYNAWSRTPRLALRYLMTGRELDNFTYRISNVDELAAFLADALGVPEPHIAGYLRELQANRILSGEVREKLRARSDRNATMPYGRRLGWYAVVRATQPAVVIETGVHDGLGSTVLLEALAKNVAEGHPGRLISFDIDAGVGWLVPDRLRPLHDLHIGDCLDLLPSVLEGRPIGVFLHDSDHRYEHETAEFEHVLPLCAPIAVLMSDNAHGSSAFHDFCVRQGLNGGVFMEHPVNHFYPGAGLGLAVKRPNLS